MLPNSQALMDAMHGLAYVVDGRMRLVAVGRPNWVRFALDNDAPEMAETDRILGRPLMEFIAGDSVRMLYATMFAALSGQPGRTVRLRYRCDAPTWRRVMDLSISVIARRRNERRFLIQSQLEEEVSRAPVPLFDQASQPPAGQFPLLSMCSICQRVCFPAGGAEESCEWLEAEAYYARGGVSAVRLSHTVCPGCFAGWTAAFASRRAGEIPPRRRFA
jgi:hypothetical protein